MSLREKVLRVLNQHFAQEVLREEYLLAEWLLRTIDAYDITRAAHGVQLEFNFRTTPPESVL